VHLGIVERTSPCDVDGAWYDEARVERAIAEKRRKIASRKKDAHVANSFRDAYARSVGFRSWQDRHAAIQANEERYRLAEEWRNSPEARLDPAIRGSGSIVTGRKMPGEPYARFEKNDAAAALGVKASEYLPTAEQLAAARLDLIKAGLMEGEEGDGNVDLVFQANAG
jgi:hypothetical protein